MDWSGSQTGMARRVLHIDIEYDFLLWALVTPLRDYRLCYYLNKLTDLELYRQRDLVVAQGKSGSRGEYALYRGVNLLDRFRYYLLSNKSAVGQYRLLPEMRQADFFILLQCPADNAWTDRVYSQLRAVQHIQTLFKVNVDELAAKQNLIFDDEDILQDQDHSHSRSSL